MAIEYDDFQGGRAVKVRKDLERHKTEGGVFTYEVLESVGKLGAKGAIDRIMGPIATGKEADVFLGIRKGKKIVVKIFRLSSASYFRKPTVLQYILGDERFKRIKRSPKSLIRSWSMKEFRNLKKAHEAGVNSPEPIAIEKNVLVMSFIGGRKPAPRLLDAGAKEPEKLLGSITAQIAKLYKSGLVHADLSEYNILVSKGKPYLIDFGQGVLLSHPNAEEFLERDARNICNFFKKSGVECEVDGILRKIKGKKSG